MLIFYRLIWHLVESLLLPLSWSKLPSRKPSDPVFLSRRQNRWRRRLLSAPKVTPKLPLFLPKLSETVVKVWLSFVDWKLLKILPRSYPSLAMSTTYHPVSKLCSVFRPCKVCLTFSYSHLALLVKRIKVSCNYFLLNHISLSYILR